MKITWFNERPKDCIVTLAINNITLNKPATVYFETAYSVMLGMDKEEKLIFIKPLTKARALRHDIADNLKYRITVRSSYSRVANKAFLKEISAFFNIDIESTSRKYKAIWDSEQQVLIANIKEEV